MTRKKLIAGTFGILLITGLSGASFAVAKTIHQVNQSITTAFQSTEVKMEPITPADEAQQWQETKQRLTQAGIQLTSEQETTLRQAQNKLVQEMTGLFQDSPGLTIVQLITASVLPETAGSALLQLTGLDKNLGNPIATYRTTVLNALTPEQRSRWETEMWERPAQEAQAASQKSIAGLDAQLAASLNTQLEPEWEAQQWTDFKQRFQKAGVPLTLQQERQMKVADEAFKTSFATLFKQSPTGTLARFAALAILPAPLGEHFMGEPMTKALGTHFQTVEQILTPEQFKVWNQGPKDDPGGAKPGITFSANNT